MTRHPRALSILATLVLAACSKSGALVVVDGGDVAGDGAGGAAGTAMSSGTAGLTGSTLVPPAMTTMPGMPGIAPATDGGPVRPPAPPAPPEPGAERPTRELVPEPSGAADGGASDGP